MVEKAAQTNQSNQQGQANGPISAPSAVPFAGLTAKQFEQFLQEHRRSTIYAAVLSGFVQSQPGATASPKNMQRVRALAEAALELMEQ